MDTKQSQYDERTGPFRPLVSFSFFSFSAAWRPPEMLANRFFCFSFLEISTCATRCFLLK